MAGFTRQEIGRNLLGGLEAALFMRGLEKRFGSDYSEALRSILIPVLAFPVLLPLVFLAPPPAVAHLSGTALGFLYLGRYAVTWALYMAFVYWFSCQIDRRTHYSRFFIAYNWLSVPAAVIVLPVIAMLASGNYSWDDIYPFVVVLILYTYAFTAFMITHVLFVPWQLGAFIAIIGMAINDATRHALEFIASFL